MTTATTCRCLCVLSCLNWQPSKATNSHNKRANVCELHKIFHFTVARRHALLDKIRTDIWLVHTWLCCMARSYSSSIVKFTLQFALLYVWQVDATNDFSTIAAAEKAHTSLYFAECHFAAVHKRIFNAIAGAIIYYSYGCCCNCYSSTATGPQSGYCRILFWQIDS